jgi:hypothetical protein
MPTKDYYTRYYLSAMTILWASTFSMSVLFFPKVYKLFYSKLFKQVHKQDEEDDLFHKLDNVESIHHVLATLAKEEEEEQEQVSIAYTPSSNQIEDKRSFLLEIYQVNIYIYPDSYLFA